MRGRRPALYGMMIALVACVAFAAAKHGQRWVGGQDAWGMDETTGSTGSPPSKRAPTELALVTSSADASTRA